jgi:c(7)-type cytochrome triheme protein
MRWGHAMNVVVKSVAVTLMLAFAPGASFGSWRLPALPSPDKFGNVLINRTSTKNGVKPATFSHWLHRRKYTCRVCHYELEFNMKTNTTLITENANKAGRFCGAGGCHDGKTAFGHEKPHCEKCHNGDLGYGREKFAELANYPAARYGNRVNWSETWREGMIAPRTYLKEKPGEFLFDKALVLEAGWNYVPPSVFPHKSHVAWLDCNNCHPDIFNIKKKGTEDLSMDNILTGEFCGACHLSVAFPLNDCRRCHPGLENEL